MRKLLNITRVVLYVLFVIDTIISFRTGFTRMYWVIVLCVALVAALNIYDVVRNRKNKQ